MKLQNTIEMDSLSFIKKLTLLVSLFVALFTDAVLIWDIVLFHLKTNPETNIPMGIAIPFFGFPIFLAIGFFSWKLTPRKFPYRKVLRIISISPFLIALVGALTA